MAEEFNSIDDFLKHKGREGGSQFLRGWKKDGYLEVWLHTKQFPIALWQHSWPRKFTSEKEDVKKVAFYMVGHNCHENERVLKAQSKKTPDGKRQVPPEKCPLCNLAVVLEEMVLDGEILWTDPIFRFTGATDPKDNVVLHAGGIYGAFGDDMTDAEKEQLKQAGIHLRTADGGGAWAENTLAKLKYVFAVVDQNNVKDGVQILVETGLLGQCVQKVINDRIDSAGPTKGNPAVTPYAIKLVYNANEKAWNKKYEARYMEKYELRPQVEELIRGEKPDLKRVVQPFNTKALRASMEQYLVPGVKLNFDRIFAGVKDLDENEPSEDTEFPHGANAKKPEEEKKQEAAPPAGRRGRRKEAAPPPEEKMGDPCEDCGAPMRADQTKCGKCGAQYDLN